MFKTFGDIRSFLHHIPEDKTWMNVFFQELRQNFSPERLDQEIIPYIQSILKTSLHIRMSADNFESLLQTHHPLLTLIGSLHLTQPAYPRLYMSGLQTFAISDELELEIESIYTDRWFYGASLQTLGCSRLMVSCNSIPPPRFSALYSLEPLQDLDEIYNWSYDASPFYHVELYPHTTHIPYQTQRVMDVKWENMDVFREHKSQYEMIFDVQGLLTSQDREDIPLVIEGIYNRAPFFYYGEPYDPYVTGYDPSFLLDKLAELLFFEGLEAVESFLRGVKNKP